MKEEDGQEEQEDTAETSEEAKAEEEQKGVPEEKAQEAVEAEAEEKEPELVEEEEAKPPLKKKKKKEEEEIVEERTYTIPLRKAWIMPPNKRAPRAIRIIKGFITKHMKLETQVAEEEETPKKLVITDEVNRKVWSKGIEKPPRKIRLRAAKDKEGNITVYLAEGD
ncbi:MAG: 50S ribosomal protein L31e [Candidatus Bathycorpusculaceae bacterium]